MEDETNHEELQEAMACQPIIKSVATRDSGELTSTRQWVFHSQEAIKQQHV